MAQLKRKYKFLFVLPFLFFFKLSVAQKEYNSWVFNDSCSIIFNGGQLLVNTIPNNIEVSDAVICDKHTGQLLFYSDGEFAYDRNGTIMPNGSGLKGGYGGTQSALIVPNPGDDSSYYLFTTDCVHLGGLRGLNYNIVDTRLNDGLGDITQKNVFVCDNLSEKVTAVRACNFDGYWIITYVDSLLDYFAYKLTPTGLDIDSPVISPSSFPGYSPDLSHDAGYLKASPNGNMLMAAFSEVQTSTCAYLYNFDKITGAISLLTKVSWSNVPNYEDQGDYGVSFSPYNSKVYFTNDRIAGNESLDLYQFDLTTDIITQIYQTNTGNTGLVGIQLGPDGKIYVANSHFDYLAVINQPDSAGSSCGFELNGVSVAPRQLFVDLPNNIDALYYPDTLFVPNFTYSLNCANSTASFTDNSNLSAQQWWWSFGDNASGSNNHSTLQNPTHQFTAPGTYTVSMWAYEGCAVDSVIKTVTVAACPVTPSLIVPTFIYGSGSQTQWHILNLPNNTAVTLYDELGRIIYKTSNYPNNYDMRNLPPAMYFYRLDLQDGEELKGKIVLVK